MSKCREEFEKAIVEHLGPAALVGGTMSNYESAEIMFKAAWNARGKVDAEICRDKAGRVNSSWIPNDCAEAIEKENER